MVLPCYVFSQAEGGRDLRVYGRLDRAGGGVDEQAIRAVEDGSGAFMRIGHRGAWALVRTDLPHIAYHEAPDGSFAIVDGELFPGGPGNTSYEGGDFATIIESVDRRLFTLPADTIVLPGHGDRTTIGAERPHLQEWVDRGW